MKVEIWFVRHGQSDVNLERGVVRVGFDAPLNETGRAQAAQVGAKIQGQDFVAVYASPYRRTQETMQIALATHITPDGDKLIVAPVVTPFPEPRTDERLRERDFTAIDGKPITKESYRRLWRLDEAWGSILGEESLYQMASRVKEFLAEIAKKHDGEKILIFSHGGVAMVTRLLLFGPPDDLSLYSFPKLENGVILRYDFTRFSPEVSLARHVNWHSAIA